MGLDALHDQDCDFLITQVAKKFFPVFTNTPYNAHQKRAIYRYLFSRRPQKLPPSLKSRVINLYDPLADRSFRFPDGLRFCINVYVGCEHNCTYCCVNGYSREAVGAAPRPKVKFAKKLNEDVRTLRALGVPPAPLHLSNSTDPLQARLESRHRHALLALEEILTHRRQFTSLVMITKNPEILCSEPYLSFLKAPQMQPLTVQVTCAYWRDEVRRFFEPQAPSVPSRLRAIEFLASQGIHLELRLDPLFPSSRIGETVRRHRPLSEYALPEAQSEADLAKLIGFAGHCGVKAIIAKPLKIPVSRKSQGAKNLFASLYAEANVSRKRTARGGSWRLPRDYQNALISSVREMCAGKGLPFKHCLQDLLARR